MADMTEGIAREVEFTVNGGKCKVGCEASSFQTLMDYIRECLELRGTKYMCREAGCGACIVNIRRPSEKPFAVNSCMIPIVACHGLEVTTIEGIGNKHDGYHVLQTTLAENNGSQCGHCSPGWVMAMYSLLKTKPDRTMLELEESLSSNICRCTGYRAILQAFKKFAKDAPKEDRIVDIEDVKICGRNGRVCQENCNDKDEWCFVNKFDIAANQRISIKLKDGKYWYRVVTVKDIFEVLKEKGDDSYMLVAGNTAKGAYPIEDYPQTLIDINGVTELKDHKLDQNLIIGGGVTLTELLNICKEMANVEYFDYLQKFYEHLEKVAHIPVRNIGTIAGNLMIKHKHNFFPSDIFLLFETVGAQLTIVNRKSKKQSVTMQDFLKLNMKGVVILNVMLPPLCDKYVLVTFKIMPIRISAHAIINAGFLIKLCQKNKVQNSRIVYGGLSPSFIRACNTENYLVGRDLFTNETLQSALKILNDELVVTEEPPEPKAEYRRKTALTLFYKALLNICPKNRIDPRFQSGAIKLHDTRSASQARQVYEADPSKYPLNQPIPKIDGLYQCAGEAFYTEDLPSLPREVFAAFTVTTVGSGNIVSIDAEEALSQPGVIAFYSAKDIPGLNSFTPDNPSYLVREEVFCSGTIKYFNQPFGVIVAEAKCIAERAAKLVKAKYENVRKPVINIREAVKDPHRVTIHSSTHATDRGEDIQKVIVSGNVSPSQFHFTLENIVCVIHPIEEGLKVFTASHYVDCVHFMLSRALNIDQSRIDVYVRRAGGSFGLKLTRNVQSAVACGLVVQKLNRPCRFIQCLTRTTKSVGKRMRSLSNFELGANSSGVIQYMDYNIYQDFGHSINELTIATALSKAYNNCYDISRWNAKCCTVTTDTAKNTWCRANGPFEGIAQMELLMEQISYELSLDPVHVRLNNLDREIYNDMEEMYKTLKNKANYDERRKNVDKFNQENRWKKRGLRFSLLRWSLEALGNFDVILSVFQGDGTVAITHGAIEIGQGINTKAAQICSYYLKIPLEKIQIKGCNTITSPNSFEVGGSVGSQNLSVGIRKCCEKLLKRLEPIKREMPNGSWEEIVQAAYIAGLDLQTQSHISPKDSSDFPYDVFGAALAEVEIDVLTGEMEILRVDLLEDVGQSVNPEIDIGQVEGAFMMGVGIWTCEKMVYKETGELLTNRTWNYFVPRSTDIPRDLRVYFRKKSYSYDAIFGAKAVAEPPLCMAVCVPLAIREAISEARSESRIPRSKWFPIDGPSTVDVIGLLTAPKIEDLKYY